MKSIVKHAIQLQKFEKLNPDIRDNVQDKNTEDPKRKVPRIERFVRESLQISKINELAESEYRHTAEVYTANVPILASLVYYYSDETNAELVLEFMRQLVEKKYDPVTATETIRTLINFISTSRRCEAVCEKLDTEMWDWIPDEEDSCLVSRLAGLMETMSRFDRIMSK
jgi:hypothetical protein